MDANKERGSGGGKWRGGSKRGLEEEEVKRKREQCSVRLRKKEKNIYSKFQLYPLLFNKITEMPSI